MFGLTFSIGVVVGLTFCLILVDLSFAASLGFQDPGRHGLVDVAKSGTGRHKGIEPGTGQHKGSEHIFMDESRVFDKTQNATFEFIAPSDGTKAFINNNIWKESLTSKCPAGIPEQRHTNWRKKVRKLRVVKMEEGCGRMQNRLLTFSDGSKACARYRVNVDQLQGEIYSYYLSKLLNITNLTPTVIQLVNSKDSSWDTVHLDIVSSGWATNKPVILTEWFDSLSAAYIPDEIKPQTATSAIISSNTPSLLKKSFTELCELVQWSDLVVFDYLTANLDRIVNNLFNRQWNSNMLNQPAHNLYQDSLSGNLVFLDNESGLFHGYRLIEKYEQYHKFLLDSVCVFRRSTVDKIKQFYEAGDLGEKLNTAFKENELHHKSVPQIPSKNIKVLNSRLEYVYHHIQSCHSR